MARGIGMAPDPIFDRFRPTPPAEKNVGGRERLVRAILGPTLLVVGLATLVGVLSLGGGVSATVVGLVAVVAGMRLTITARTQKCYLNERLGRNTYRPR